MRKYTSCLPYLVPTVDKTSHRIESFAVPFDQSRFTVRHSKWRRGRVRRSLVLCTDKESLHDRIMLSDSVWLSPRETWTRSNHILNRCTRTRILVSKTHPLRVQPIHGNSEFVVQRVPIFTNDLPNRLLRMQILTNYTIQCKISPFPISSSPGMQPQGTQERGAATVYSHTAFQIPFSLVKQRLQRIQRHRWTLRR